jgi:hypothetical protein
MVMDPTTNTTCPFAEAARLQDPRIGENGELLPPFTCAMCKDKFKSVCKWNKHVSCKCLKKKD